MHCGTPLAPVPVAPAYIPAKPNRTWLWVTLGTLLMALVALGLLTATGILRFGASTGPEVLQVKGNAPTRVLEARGEGPGTALQATGERPERKEMPRDVYDWLEHLRRTEEKRKAIATDQVSTAMVTMTELQVAGGLDALKGLLDAAEDPSAEVAPPTQQVQIDTEAMRGQWTQLIQFFESVPAPAECVPIRDRYSRVLYETSGMITDILGSIENSKTDPQAAISALNGMRGRSEQAIGTPAKEAERLVGEICAKYDVRKWFSVEADFGGGGLLRGGF